MENFEKIYLKSWVDFCSGVAFGGFLYWLSEVIYGTALFYFAEKLINF